MSDKVQSFCSRMDVSKKLLKEHLRLAIDTALMSSQEVAVKVVNYKDKHYSLCLPPRVYSRVDALPVILISGQYVSCRDNYKPRSYFEGHRPWRTFTSSKTHSARAKAIRYVLKLLKDNGPEWGVLAKEKFRDNFGKGFSFGYEITTCDCFPQQIAISIILLYQGK